MKRMLTLLAATASLPALAHEGHGLLGSHWHSTDVMGFLGVAGALAVAIWLSRK